MRILLALLLASSFSAFAGEILVVNNSNQPIHADLHLSRRGHDESIKLNINPYFVQYFNVPEDTLEGTMRVQELSGIPLCAVVKVNFYDNVQIVVNGLRCNIQSR